jgi:PucR C-terminal helix-turn-helix domain
VDRQSGQVPSDRQLDLRTLLGLIGPGSLRVLTAPSGLALPISDIVIHDPLATTAAPPAALLFAVGVDMKGLEARLLLEEARAQGATAVVFRDRGINPAELIDQATELGMTLLCMPATAGWSQLFAEVRAALVSAVGEEVTTEAMSTPIGDLFALADAIAALVGGPVTIEDPHSVVLAYSTTSDPIDEPRRQTILGRHSPAAWSARLREAGVFRRLWSGEIVRYEAPDIEGFAPRLAIGVRAGAEILGSIWVAQGATPFGPDSEIALRKSARVAALHLLHQRAAANVARVVRGEHLRSLLEGRGAVEPLAAELDLDPGSTCLVLAFALVSDDEELLTVARGVAAAVIPLHFELLHRCAASVAIGDVVYLLLPDEPELPAPALKNAAEDVVERLEHLTQVAVTAVIGAHADLLTAREARRSVDMALRVLEKLPHLKVAEIGDLRNQILLLEIGEVLTRQPQLLDGKVDVLAEQDRCRGTEYVRTLRAFFDAFGDVALAADCLGVHPNTFRYRLHRIMELAGLDLEDPDERLAVELRLRLR